MRMERTGPSSADALHRDLATDVARTCAVGRVTFARAKWMTKTGYQRILEKAVEEQRNALH